MRIHTEERVTCSQCHKNFSGARKFGIHQRVHTALNCPSCSKSFKYLYKFKRHQKTHAKDEILTLLLETSLSRAGGQQQINPTLENTFCCSSCNMYFKDSYRLKRHQKTHAKDQLLTSLLDISLSGAKHVKITERVFPEKKLLCCS